VQFGCLPSDREAAAYERIFLLQHPPAWKSIEDATSGSLAATLPRRLLSPAVCGRFGQSPRMKEVAG
jgi:hypothetical protein